MWIADLGVRMASWETDVKPKTQQIYYIRVRIEIIKKTDSNSTNVAKTIFMEATIVNISMQKMMKHQKQRAHSRMHN